MYDIVTPLPPGFKQTKKLNPTLSPNLVVLKLSPGDDLGGLGVHRFNFYLLDGRVRQLRLDNPANQKVFLLGNRHNRCPLGQQKFFGAQWVHGFKAIKTSLRRINHGVQGGL